MTVAPIRPVSGSYPVMAELARITQALAALDANTRQEAIVTRAREERPTLSLRFPKKGAASHIALAPRR